MSVECLRRLSLVYHVKSDVGKQIINFEDDFPKTRTSRKKKIRCIIVVKHLILIFISDVEWIY